MDFFSSLSTEWFVVFFASAGVGLWAMTSSNRLPLVLEQEISKRIQRSVVEHDTEMGKS